jgi:4-amino-4-deoxy-L-arabinose transferase-like glycosyltransferase
MTKNVQQNEYEERIFSFVLKTVLIIIFSIFFMVVVAAFFPYPQVAGWVNRLAADGTLESFTPVLFGKIRLSLLIFGFVFLGFDLFALYQFRHTKKIILTGLKRFAVFLQAFMKDWKTGLIDIRTSLDKKTILILVVLVTLALLMRIGLLWQPMEHDESYTSVVFAFEPLVNGLSDYHFPNNHVFHTFLVHLVYSIFGAKEWVVRLPAFLAGVSLAPLGYILARRWYGKQTALLAGLMIAVLPDLIGYSVRARGYSQLALFTLLIFICADITKTRKNRAVWFLLGICGALGFYTLPIMAYPLAMLYVWLAGSWLFNDFSRSYTRLHFAVYTIGSGLLAAGLGMALYLPIFRNWGVSSLFANPYVEAISKEFYGQTLLVRMQETWQVLNWGALPGIGFLLVMGLFLSIIFHKQLSSSSVSLPLVSIVVITLLVLVQRPNVYARTWHFYFPLLCIWAAAGMTKVVNNRALSLPWLGKRKVSSLVVVVVALLFFVNGLTYVVEKFPQAQKGEGTIEQATLYLKQNLQEDDIVVITAIDDAPMWFYFEKYGLGREYFSRSKPFSRAFVVVTTSDKNQTLDFVIADRGPDPVFFDRQTTQKVEMINDLDIYLIEANHDAIRQEYDLP